MTAESGCPAGGQVVIRLPSVGGMARHGLGHLIESTVAPLVLFYLALSSLGLRWALAVAVAWSYGALARRLVQGRGVPGMLLLGTALFTVRALVALATGSAFVYFLQPTLGTFAVSGLFLASVPMRRPLAERLARDFCALPESVLGRGRIRAFFLRISLLWAFVYLANGAATLALLLTSSLGTFLVAKTVITTLTMLTAVAGSALWFRRSLRAEGMSLGWERRAVTG